MKKNQYTIEADKAIEFLLLLIIGALQALKHGKMTVDETEWYIFSPSVARTLQKHNYPIKLIKLILEGAELEDIVRLIPHTYSDTLDDLMERALTMLGKQKSEYKACSFSIAEE